MLDTWQGSAGLALLSDGSKIGIAIYCIFLPALIAGVWGKTFLTKHFFRRFAYRVKACCKVSGKASAIARR